MNCLTLCKWKHFIQRGNFHALAKIENQSWGVLLNNNNSIILADLNSSKKIKIIRAVDVDYFLSDDNKTIKPIKNPQVDSWLLILNIIQRSSNTWILQK